MSVPNRPRLRSLLLIALFVAAVVAVSFAILPRSRSNRPSVVESIRQRGATVVVGLTDKNGLPSNSVFVDLSRTAIDAELMQALGQLTAIERLILDGAKLQPQDWVLVSKCPRLHNLSLSHSNVSDADVLGLPLGFTKLLLKGTAITDKSMPHLAAMRDLTDLDLSETNVTSDGLRLLEPLTSLEALWIDESCITPESVETLGLMQPKNIGVAGVDGLGRETYELLSVCKGPRIRGYHRDGYELWTTVFAWSHTLAGVVEAVVAEVGLDSEQAAQLLDVLGKDAAKEGWGPGRTPPVRPDSVSYLSYGSDLPDRGLELASLDDFIRVLEDPRASVDAGRNSRFDYWAVRRFVREKFTTEDIPKLLAAMRAANYSRDDRLFSYGPFLLAHFGAGDPEVLAELDRLLAHQNSFVRSNTMCAFGYGGASPFYSREEWTASKAADAFAVPRLLRICQDIDKHEQIRDGARIVLTEITLRRPEYAAEVIPVLVGLLDEECPWHFEECHRQITADGRIRGIDLWRLADVDRHAAIAAVPRLRKILRKLDERLAGVPAESLEVFTSPHRVLHCRRLSVAETLSAFAHQSPTLVHEIALEYLSRMEHGHPAGPFATLLSPDTPDTNRMVVMAFLNNPSFPKTELGSIANKMRDWTTTNERSGK